ncbi:transcriptional regulator, AraC family [Thalassospira xiamenensis M-5 = DSM 17429]|uniref:AraC family transcriptional regulator n=1 Tax=Thalassospira xiamenensis M-5 = DSM 17429 TaxID=1123366 RepID=A0AB72U9S5_9PROT|nr:AraC family transcriptional regulator [Thalassospira xiamenensis]AJD51035.1 AraC family transcriptional regulator [Thalassospira xiamenensis M-5 = DSM 17429]SIT25474.1 transcriptional regulator, AraC family [Thalassospira xiamenensis M-5 = DSM 17429]
MIKSTQYFWRDDALPFVELRRVVDGRAVCSERHSHDTFSIGTVNGGYSTYWNRGRTHETQAGAVVILNPEDVHGCNPVKGADWRYDMLFVDPEWILDLQIEIDADAAGKFAGFSDTLSHNPRLYDGLSDLADILINQDIDVLGKETAMVSFFGDLHVQLDRRGVLDGGIGSVNDRKMIRVGEYIRAHFDETISLDELARQAGYSRSYLVRAFKKAHGMTPYAYLINCRVQKARHALKRGERIVDVALDCGFADQAHFQRVFKRLMATTPRHYAMAHVA